MDDSTEKQQVSEETKQEVKEVNIRSEIFSWIKTFAFAFGIAFLINNYVIVNATVPTGSMENIIMPKDRIMANRWAYARANPKRGDIVVFRYPDDEKVLYVKRVIGLPGETIEVRNGNVYINDQPLEESYLHEYMGGEFPPVRIPENGFFMMGDNRNNSLDARFWENKFVEKNKILGKVFLKYFPKIQWLGDAGNVY